MSSQSGTARGGRGTWLPSRSLRGKLLQFAAALVLLPGIVLTLIAERSARDALQPLIGAQLAREATHTAEGLSAVLRRERATLATFAQQDLMREIRVADIDKRVSMALATLCEGSPARLAYLVVEPAGRVVASSDPSLLGPRPGWLQAAWLGSEEEGVFGPLPPAPAQEPRVVMTAPVRDPDEPAQQLGTLVGILDWGSLTAVTTSVRDDLAAQGMAADVLVTTPDGTVLGGARSAAAGELPSSALAPSPGARRSASHSAYWLDERGKQIVGHAALPDDLPDWRILVVEPRGHALAPVRRLSARLALTMGVALLAALALAAVAARRVVRPLARLTHAIHGLADGDASALPVPVQSEDEVGTLARAFNEMAANLDAAQRELVEAEKFAFVGQLASGVAHEVRTALGVLGSSAQMLERSLPADVGEQSIELAEMIRAEVGRLAGVVNDLLTLDRVRPLRLEAVRLWEPLRRAVAFLEPQAREKAVKVVPGGPADGPRVSCDPDLVQQIAVNIVVNAIQAAPLGGRVEVRVLEAVDGYGGFEIRDDGPGIPESIRDRIFQPFVTAREGGVGLGLTFVKKVVHDHHGWVGIESAPGRGTRVEVRLPLAEGEA
jgi:signal transduction histidine kinase